MGKPGRAVFDRIRKERRVALRRNAGRLLLVMAIMTGGGSATVWMLVATGHPYQATFMAGVFVTAFVGLIAHFFTVLGTVTRRIGGTAEQWTAKAMRRLDKRRYIVLNHVLAGEFDIDHVVVTGQHLVAVETKWTTQSLGALPNGHLKGINQAWLRQADRSARWVQAVLEEAGHQVLVTPVLVVWGPGVGNTESGRFNSGRIQVLIGEQARLWSPFLRELLGNRPADEEVVSVLLAAGEAH